MKLLSTCGTCFLRKCRVQFNPKLFWCFLFVLHAIQCHRLFFRFYFIPVTRSFIVWCHVWWCLCSIFFLACLFIPYAKAIIKQFPFMDSDHQYDQSTTRNREIPVLNCEEWIKIIYALCSDLVPLLDLNYCHKHLQMLQWMNWIRDFGNGRVFFFINFISTHGWENSARKVLLLILVYWHFHEQVIETFGYAVKFLCGANAF